LESDADIKQAIAHANKAQESFRHIVVGFNEWGKSAEIINSVVRKRAEKTGETEKSVQQELFQAYFRELAPDFLTFEKWLNLGEDFVTWENACITEVLAKEMQRKIELLGEGTGIEGYVVKSIEVGYKRKRALFKRYLVDGDDKPLELESQTPELLEKIDQALDKLLTKPSSAIQAKKGTRSQNK
jgi:hypothetical protein